MQTNEARLDPKTCLVELNWPLNAHWAEETIRAFKEIAIQGAKRVVVNMENVPFIDSSGLRALLIGMEYLEGNAAQGWLAAPQAQARLFFKITNFDKVFRISERIPEAFS